MSDYILSELQKGQRLAVAGTLASVLLRLTRSTAQLADHFMLRIGNYITCVSGGFTNQTNSAPGKRMPITS